ncbi:MAG: energy transducer TonB [Bacteroidia bacterium]|nr:energy transducer TonB [Bacteroidia bacterium]
MRTWVWGIMIWGLLLPAMAIGQTARCRVYLLDNSHFEAMLDVKAVKNHFSQVRWPTPDTTRVITSADVYAVMELDQIFPRGVLYLNTKADNPPPIISGPDAEPVPINISRLAQYIGYPDIAREANIQGQVIIRVLIDKNGTPLKWKSVNRVHPILLAAVVAHLPLIRFTPGRENRKAIKFWVNIPFNFRLVD